MESGLWPTRDAEFAPGRRARHQKVPRCEFMGSRFGNIGRLPAFQEEKGEPLTAVVPYFGRLEANQALREVVEAQHETPSLDRTAGTTPVPSLEMTTPTPAAEVNEE